MLEEMVQAVIRKVIAVKYPHLALPAVVLARVTAAAELDVYAQQEVTVQGESTGEISRGQLSYRWYAYTLTVLDRFGSPDGKFPALPQVKSRKRLEAGAVAAVALLYGELDPVIIGEVRL